jgi:hypothetical protein
MKIHGGAMKTPSIENGRTQPRIMDESFLAILARGSAMTIVERHAPDIRNRDALVEAIARVVLIGLEGHVRLYATGQSKEVPE